MIVHPAGGPSGPTVTFWGAAQSVSGSMHLVEAAGRKILLDCGRSLSSRAEARRTVAFPFAPHDIAAVVLTHAHMDHCGNLPHLVRQGFTGPIYCTPPTRDLVGLMLGDSARRDEDDARVIRVLEPEETEVTGTLLSREDVARTVCRCVALPYDEERPITPGVTLRFVDAGHLLGSAMAVLTITGGGRDYRITYTGDLGRRGLPLLREPAPVPEADLLICESTYGGRDHEPFARVCAELADIVRRTVERNGKALVPAFSLGRTQVILCCLRGAMRDGRLPEVPVFIDSPMAADIADVYRRHPECLDAETRRRLQAGDDPFNGPGVEYVLSAERSRELAERREPCVVLAASAMCDGGRIMRHLKQNLDDPRASVVLVSYQAPDSLGRRLLEPRPTVRFHGRDWNLWADVVALSGFSGHADRRDFLVFLGPLAGRTKHVRLVHGDPEQAAALAEALRARGFRDVTVPERGEKLTLA